MYKKTNDKKSHRICVIKVAKPGYDVKDPTKHSSGNNTNKRILPRLLAVLALPYLNGARVQVERYLCIARNYRNDSIGETQNYIHEVSTLFEDLDTVREYVNRCGKNNKLDKLWLTIRNHIRHDVRERLDDENYFKKVKAATRLGIHKNLQMDMSFTVDRITIGKTIVKIKEIIDYLDWAEKIIKGIIDDAKASGHYRVEKT